MDRPEQFWVGMLQIASACSAFSVELKHMNWELALRPGRGRYRCGYCGHRRGDSTYPTAQMLESLPVNKKPENASAFYKVTRQM